MTTNSVWVASLLLATLAMMPAAAHVLELPNKIGLSGIEYLTVQRLYRGWAFARLVVVAALMSMLVLLFMVREFPTMAVSIMRDLAQRLDSTNNQLRTALSEVRRLREGTGAAGATAAPAA